jgi:hypothetical protein
MAKQGVIQLSVLVKGIQIPRALPSQLFVSYHVDGFSGRSTLIQANAESKPINHMFTFQYIHGLHTDIEFALNTKSSIGFLRLGEQTVPIPPAVADGDPHEADFTITSETGTFTISLTFQIVRSLLTEDDIPPDALAKYTELVSTIPPSLDKATAQSKFLNPKTGIAFQLASVARGSPNAADLHQLQSLTAILEAKIQQSQFQADFVATSGMMLMLPSIQFVTIDGTVLNEERAIDAKAVKYPLLAVFLCQKVEACFTGELAVPETEVETAFLDLVRLLLELLASPQITERKLVAILSVAYVLVEFMQQKYGKMLVGARNNLEGVYREAMGHWIDMFDRVLRNHLKSPGEAKSALLSRQLWFAGFGFPPSVYESVRLYLLQRLDHAIALNWIGDASTEPLKAELWSAVAPDFSFPLVTGVSEIAKNATLIIKKKRKLNTFRTDLTGIWMSRILKKMKCSPGDVDKLIGARPGPGPEPEDLDEWIRANLPFDHSWKVPEKWPPLKDLEK